MKVANMQILNWIKFFSNDQVISSLRRALQPAVTDLSIKFDVPPSFEVYQAPEEIPTLFSGDKIVVYGIMKQQKKSTSDQSFRASVNGTATLTGQVLSKPIQFKLTFEILPPSDFQSSVEMPIVHQLASKAFIHELQSREDWTAATMYKQQKKAIVDLSIESGVVSAHTAYIALDEEQEKLIEGAVKTWDVVATMAQYRKSMSHCIPPRNYHKESMLSLTSPIKEKKKKRDNRKIDLDDMKSINGQLVQRHHSKAVYGSRRPLKLHGQLRPSAKDEEVERLHTETQMPIARKRQQSTANQVAKPRDNLEFLIFLQKYEGFWDLDVLQWLNLPALMKIDNIQICATVYALAYMEIKFPSQRDEWELVARKAEAWLECQTLLDQVNLEELKKEASDSIINNLVE